jgi:hypothetical protein
MIFSAAETSRSVPREAADGDARDLADRIEAEQRAGGVAAREDDFQHSEVLIAFSLRLHDFCALRRRAVFIEVVRHSHDRLVGQRERSRQERPQASRSAERSRSGAVLRRCGETPIRHRKLGTGLRQTPGMKCENQKPAKCRRSARPQ